MNNLDQTKKSGQIFEILKTFQHPKYTGNAYYDIALLQIAPVKFNVRLRPICLPDSSEFNVNEYNNVAADLIGWDNGDYLGLTSRTLKIAGLKIYQYR